MEWGGGGRVCVWVWVCVGVCEGRGSENDILTQ